MSRNRGAAIPLERDADFPSAHRVITHQNPPSPIPNADAPVVSLTGGFICPPWMAVIVGASTGVTYENQTGGRMSSPASGGLLRARLHRAGFTGTEGSI